MIRFPLQYLKKIALLRRKSLWKSVSERRTISNSCFRLCMISLCFTLTYIQLSERKVGRNGTFHASLFVQDSSDTSFPQFIRISKDVVLNQSLNIIESIEGDGLTNLAPFSLDTSIADEIEGNFGLVACIR